MRWEPVLFQRPKIDDPDKMRQQVQKQHKQNSAHRKAGPCHAAFQKTPRAAATKDGKFPSALFGHSAQRGIIPSESLGDAAVLFPAYMVKLQPPGGDAVHVALRVGTTDLKTDAIRSPEFTLHCQAPPTCCGMRYLVSSPPESAFFR